MVGSQVANKLKLGSFHDSGRSMDDTCHLTVIIDSSPQQWYKSAAPPTSAATDPLSFETFMPQLLAFLNAHLALKHENTLSVIGAYPGKRFASSFRVVLVAALILSSVVLFSSEDSYESVIQPDPNTYQPFKAMNTLIMERQHETLTNLANTKGMLSISGKRLSLSPSSRTHSTSSLFDEGVMLYVLEVATCFLSLNHC